MTTCGYICPICEGNGLKEDGSNCDWCVDSKSEVAQKAIIEDWIEKVHQGSCCSDSKE